MRIAPARIAGWLAVGLSIAPLAKCRLADLREVVKRTIARLPDTHVPGQIAVTDDGADVGYTDWTPDLAKQVVHDGRTGPVFEDVHRPWFRPRTRDVVYWGLDEKSDGTQVALWIGDRAAATVEFGGDFRFPTEPFVVFSRDGKRWAATVETVAQSVGEDEARESYVVLVDGTTTGHHAAVVGPAFSPDGRHVAWLAQDDAGASRLFVDGAVQRTYELPRVPCDDAVRRRGPLGTLPQYRVRYLADGSLLVLARDRRGWTVFRDDEPLAAYAVSRWEMTPPADDRLRTAAQIDVSSLRVAESAPVAAWWERPSGPEDRWRVVRDGAPVDDVVCTRSDYGPALSDDGRHVAYACETGSPPHTQDWVVHDGHRYGPYATVSGWAVSLSRDGAHVAYGAAARGEPATVLVDGVPRYRSRQADGAVLREVRLDPEGRHAVWLAAVRVDDGSPVVQQELVVGIDGRSITRADAVPWGPTFTSSGGVSWVVNRGRALSRIDARLRRPHRRGTPAP
jgi:hypothetical protein